MADQRRSNYRRPILNFLYCTAGVGKRAYHSRQCGIVKLEPRWNRTSYTVVCLRRTTAGESYANSTSGLNIFITSHLTKTRIMALTIMSAVFCDLQSLVKICLQVPVLLRIYGTFFILLVFKLFYFSFVVTQTSAKCWMFFFVLFYKYQIGLIMFNHLQARFTPKFGEKNFPKIGVI